MVDAVYSDRRFTRAEPDAALPGRFRWDPSTGVRGGDQPIRLIVPLLFAWLPRSGDHHYPVRRHSRANHCAPSWPCARAYRSWIRAPVYARRGSTDSSREAQNDGRCCARAAGREQVLRYLL